MALARRVDPDRFWSVIFAPPATRDALACLIGFNHELARAREATTNPIAMLIRLQWWRDMLAEAEAGAPPRRHEVAAPLRAAIDAGTLPLAPLAGLVDAREAEGEAIPTAGALSAYLRAGAGGLSVLAGQVVGAGVVPALQTAGALHGLAGVLRSVAAHAAQGRCLLPLDAVLGAGLTPDGVIADPARAGALVRRMAAEALVTLPDLRLAGPTVAAALPAVLARRDLRRLARGQDVAVPRGFADRVAVIWCGTRAAVRLAPVLN